MKRKYLMSAVPYIIILLWRRFVINVRQYYIIISQEARWLVILRLEQKTYHPFTSYAFPVGVALGAFKCKANQSRKHLAWKEVGSD